MGEAVNRNIFGESEFDREHSIFVACSPFSTSLLSHLGDSARSVVSVLSTFEIRLSFSKHYFF